MKINNNSLIYKSIFWGRRIFLGNLIKIRNIIYVNWFRQICRFLRIITTHLFLEIFYLHTVVAARTLGCPEFLRRAALWTRSTLLINHCLPAGSKTTASLIHPLCRRYLLLLFGVFQLLDLSPPTLLFSLPLSLFLLVVFPLFFVLQSVRLKGIWNENDQAKLNQAVTNVIPALDKNNKKWIMRLKTKKIFL